MSHRAQDQCLRTEILDLAFWFNNLYLFGFTLKMAAEIFLKMSQKMRESTPELQFNPWECRQIFKVKSLGPTKFLGPNVSLKNMRLFFYLFGANKRKNEYFADESCLSA